MSPKLTRRRALGTLGAWVGGATFGLVGLDVVAQTPVAARELRTFVRRQLQPDAASLELGRAFLRRFPEQTDPDELARRVGLRPDELDVERLRERIALEFAAGHTLYLRGWLVTRTEARLCALAL